MHLRPLHDRIIVQRLEEVSVDGVDYLIMREDDVLAIQERNL